LSPEVVQEYLEIMGRQRREVFADLADMPGDVLWRRPKPKEWSIGEILDHTRVLNTCSLRMLRAAWVLTYPWAALRRHSPYSAHAENVYERPGFPMNVGWLWPPKHNAERPVALDVLRRELATAHHTASVPSTRPGSPICWATPSSGTR